MKTKQKPSNPKNRFQRLSISISKKLKGKGSQKKPPLAAVVTDGNYSSNRFEMILRGSG